MLAKRYELKYFLNHETAERLRRDLVPHTVKDPYCRQNDSYLVNSLYFDSPDFQFFSDKIEGHRYRYKIRLRTYGQDSDRVFLEMKKKINSCIYKTRADAPLEKIRILLKKAPYPPDDFFDSPRLFQGVDDIYYIARQFRVAPAVGVVYHRRALMGKKDDRLRITFDEQVAANLPECGLDLPERPKLLFDPHRVILEIKVNNSVPLWLACLIEKYNLELRSISKYCHAVMVQNVYSCDMRY